MARLSGFDPRRDWPALVVSSALVLALFLTLLSPEPSAGRSTLGRFGFWLFHALGAFALCQVATVWVTAFDRPAWAAITVGGVLGGLLFAPLAFGYDLILPVPSPNGDANDLLGEVTSLVPPVALAWVALNGLRFLELSGGQAERSPDARAPAFVGKSQRLRGGEIISFSAELHYLRVRTTLDQDLILHPFGAAVAAMDGQQGMQIHRSHWASFGAIARVETRGSAGAAVMKDGTELPVARARLAELRAAIAARD